jgi:ATP synthase protein I
MPPSPTKLFQKSTEFLRYSSLGLEMGIAVAIGLGIGWWLDKVFHTKPWLTLVFLLFGVVAGFKNIYLLLKKQEENEKREHDGSPPDSGH